MPTFDEVLALAKRLDPHQRERLAREIAPGLAAGLAPLPTLANRPPAPQSVAWVKAERGHAVLATDTGPAEADIPAGPDAILRMWADQVAEDRG